MLCKEKKRNVFVENSKALVGIVESSDNVKEDIEKAVRLIGGFKKLKGEKFLLRPNFNSPDPYPGSTAFDFLQAVIDLLRENGAKEIVIAESSGVGFVPTTGVLQRLGVFEFCKKNNVKLLVLDKRKFISVDVNGRYLKKISFSYDIYKLYDTHKFIYLPIMKVHKWARFTLSLKMCMAFPKVKDRFLIHSFRLEEKIAELNKILQPDLIIMDGRVSFVTRGPESGDVVKPGVILASGDMVAIDVEALKILKKYKAENRLDMPIWEFPQIKVASQLGICARSEKDYKVVK